MRARPRPMATTTMTVRRRWRQMFRHAMRRYSLMSGAPFDHSWLCVEGSICCISRVSSLKIQKLRCRTCRAISRGRRMRGNDHRVKPGVDRLGINEGQRAMWSSQNTLDGVAVSRHCLGHTLERLAIGLPLAEQGGEVIPEVVKHRKDDSTHKLGVARAHPTFCNPLPDDLREERAIPLGHGRTELLAHDGVLVGVPDIQQRQEVLPAVGLPAGDLLKERA